MQGYMVTVRDQNMIHQLTVYKLVTIANTPREAQAACWSFLTKEIPDPKVREDAIRAAEIEELEIGEAGVAHCESLQLVASEPEI